MFGQAILVSDTCVTFTSSAGERSYVDCLQKIYPLGKYVIGGFAGSVRIGFNFLEFLRSRFAITPNNEAWSIDVIASTWLPRDLRKVYSYLPDSEKQIGKSSIILAWAHPCRQRGDAPWPWTAIHKFESPDFKPQRADVEEVLSIGVGSAIPRYERAIKDACSSETFMKSTMGGLGAQATFLASAISATVEELPVPGISSAFQLGIITRGRYTIADHRQRILGESGSWIDTPFPRTAKNYDEFQQLCSESKNAPQGAVCFHPLDSE